MHRESRLAKRFGISIVLVAVLGGAWLWTHLRASRETTDGTATQLRRGPAPAPASLRTAQPVEPARLTITVIDDAGPLAGAAVRLAPEIGEVVVVETGRDGTAHADHLEPGAWTISASAAAHLPSALPKTRLAAGADDKLTLRLAAGGSVLTGTVSDATGGPIAGARIDAARLTSLAQPRDAVSTTFTGTDGKYRMTVADGPLLVAAASADYAPQSRYVEVGPDGAVADFALVPGGAIEGIVRDARTRQPVAGASVVARRDSPAMLLAEYGPRRATAGPDGRFRMGGLRPGAWDIAASAQTRHSKSQTIIGLGVAEQVSDIELLIDEGPVIRGRVIDDTDTPATGVTVTARSRGDNASASTDTAGAFALEGLAPGSYSVVARGDAYVAAGGVRVALGDKDVDGVVLRVKRGVALTGHVEPRQPCDIQSEIDQPRNGMPSPSPGATSGPDGAFTLGPLAPGAVKLTARCTSGDQGAIQVTVSPGMPDAVLRVTPGASIAGRVLDGAGKPVAGTEVMASQRTDGERTMIMNGRITSGVHGLTDATGAYKLVGLSPGSFRVSALDRGKPLPLHKPAPTVELAANEDKTGVDLVIDRANGVIQGTVTGPDGAPLADAWVSLHQDMLAMFGGGDDARRPGPGAPESRTMVVEARDTGGGADGGAFPPALTDARGHYEIRGLPHATFTVTAEAQRGQLRARATDIKPDATVDLRALGVTTLEGKVTGPNGPVALFSVELEGPTRTQRSFTDGAYSFTRVDPGTYTVNVTSSDGNGQATVAVVPDQPTTLDIALAANAIVTGRLVDASGRPVADQAITLVADTGDDRLGIRIEGVAPTTAADGGFRLEQRAGRFALVVLRSPPFLKRGLALEAGKTLDLGAVALDAPGPEAGPGGGSGSGSPSGTPRRRIAEAR